MSERKSKAGAAEPTRTHWKMLTDPRFIGAYALPNGDDLTVTINYVQRETITMMGGKKEDHSLMYLCDGWKPMILNATNSKAIEKLYGPYIEDWSGKRITLYVSTTKMGSEMVACLRIRAKIPRDENAALPALPEERLAKAIESIAAGQYSAAKLRAQFALTPEQEARVAAAEGGAA